MNLSAISKKYAKLAVGTPTSENALKMVWSCPLCGDTKNRLSLTAVKDDDGIFGCWNAGCELSDQPRPFGAALELLAPHLSTQYKTERFKSKIEIIKESQSLNDILKNVVSAVPVETAKVETIKAEKPKTAKLKSKLVMPQMFLDLLVFAKDVPEAVKYIEDRGLTVEDDWMFSRDSFIKIIDKSYFVENFIFIPLWQYGKLKGFYTRSINEKRFSTITFPSGEKYWASKDFDEDDTVFVFEGIMDALSSGLENTVAMLSADLPEELLEDLKEPIFCFDNDETGVMKAIKYNELGYKTFVWPESLEKDMNERLQKGYLLEDNKHLILSNIFSGLTGKIRLNLSKF